MGCAVETHVIYGTPTSHFAGLKGPASNMLVPHTKAPLWGSGGVHASMGQVCFCWKKGEPSLNHAGVHNVLVDHCVLLH